MRSLLVTIALLFTASSAHADGIDDMFDTTYACDATVGAMVFSMCLIAADALNTVGALPIVLDFGPTIGTADMTCMSHPSEDVVICSEPDLPDVLENNPLVITGKATAEEIEDAAFMLMTLGIAAPFVCVSDPTCSP